MNENTAYQSICERLYGDFPNIKCLVLVNSESKILASKFNGEGYDIDVVRTVSSLTLKWLTETLKDWQKKEFSQVLVRNQFGIVIIQQISENIICAILVSADDNIPTICKNVDTFVRQLKNSVPNF